MPEAVLAGDHLPVPPPGNSAFYPALLSYLHNASPNSTPLDPVVLQSILLCLLAGDKHLILQTPEEDIGLVARLAVWTLTSIFGFITHKLRIRARPGLSPRSSGTFPPSANPASFLRLLFFSSASTHDVPGPEDEGSIAGNRTGSSAQCKKHSRSRSKLKSQSSRSPPSSSSPSDPTLFKHTSLCPTPHSALTRPDSIASKQLTSGFNPPSPRFSVSREQDIPQSLATKVTELPRALVVSGLENAGLTSQRSLAKVLMEKKIVLEGSGTTTENHFKTREGKPWGHGLDAGENNESDDEEYSGVWNLPEGFILIYVCSWNAKERPTIHKTLLDKFAMSSTILVHQNTRNALRSLSFSSLHPIYHTYAHSNPSTPSPAHPLSLPTSQTPPSLTRPLPQPTPTNHSRQSRTLSVLSEPLIPPSFLESLREAYVRTHFSAVLSLYMSDLFSATRHHPQLDGMLLTARAVKDAEDLARAGRVLGVDPTGMELIRDTQIGSDDQNGEWYKEFGDDIESSNVTSNLPPVPLLDVSEADVARIAPRVISHRVRVRDGPEDEILSSVLFGAASDDKGKDTDGTRWGARDTIKDILISILSEV